ncbi:thioredoxin domain-containing protein [Gluconacetobacter liquefaciens]|uniref:Peroxiredoxin n=1 Tax=Gluconacetobacter liquefaciens TaxID=89584 RepID=A0A7W4JNE6_GLULI|nr:peroxiredoxin [Gluconacetobacter liquefaciens]MBB2187867.1 peroxiredoxin [Gluconacetobacter liquefaciens]
MMALLPGWMAPDFACDTTWGPIHFHMWLGAGWGVVLTHVDDYTPHSLQNGMEWASSCFRPIRMLGLNAAADDIHASDRRPPAPTSVPRIIDPSGAVRTLWRGIAIDVGGEASAFSDDHVVYFLDPSRTIRMTLSYSSRRNLDFSDVISVLDALGANRDCGCTPAWQAA